MKLAHALFARPRSRKRVTWMRSILCACLPALMFSGAAFAQTLENTATRSNEMLEVNSGAPPSGLTTFYVSTAAPPGWGASSCSGAHWGYFYSDRTNAKEMFALLMLAKQMGKQVQLVGTCSSADYFNVIQVLMAN
jgi:hypothetical protein